MSAAVSKKEKYDKKYDKVRRKVYNQREFIRAWIL